MKAKKTMEQKRQLATQLQQEMVKLNASVKKLNFHIDALEKELTEE